MTRASAVLAFLLFGACVHNHHPAAPVQASVALGAEETCPGEGYTSAERDGESESESDEGDVVAMSGGNQTCGAGATCSFSCPAGNCSYYCADGSTCNIECDGGNCRLGCGVGATCNLECDGGSCGMGCAQGSTCNSECDGGSCANACAHGATCNSDCDGGNCS